MPRITCKVCRRAGESLCGREKCAFKKRPFAPGRIDSERKHKSGYSEYGQQLNETRKVKATYGLREKQFSQYVFSAIEKKGINTTEVIYQNLEMRLDSVVFRCGLTHTRALARQTVNHGHIMVNGRRVNIPSFKVKVGDVVSVRPESAKNSYFIKLLEKFEPNCPSWISYQPKDNTFTIKALPAKDAEKSFNFQTIVEFYSR